MSKITNSARGEPCMVRIDGICSFDPSTTVLAHIGGGGMACKREDYEGAYCCSSCHDVIDFRVKSEHSNLEIRLWHLEGVLRTQKKLIEKGLLIVNE